MARGAQSPAPTPLPKVSFQKVIVDGKREHTGFNSTLLQTFGYNDGTDYEQPERYIRYIEPLESELDRQVEYDMDEQDEEWLKAVNEERKKEQLDKVTSEMFEIIMDRLEKEWFNLTKNIPQPDMALPSEDSTCAICDDSEGENMNAIVFCDGCNLAVHQDCYGVPYIPEGQWLCRKCTVSPETAVECVLCPNEGGAFKQTTTGEWVHLLCALWIRETQVVNPVFMEPISGVEQIPKNRWKLRCSICDVREGACIQCAKSSCYTSFHVTCARNEKLLLPMKSTNGVEASLESYCEKHLPLEQLEIRDAALRERAAEATDEEDIANGRSAKSARAYAKTYKTGPPLVPAVVIERIEAYTTKIGLRKKHEFVILVCKYWSLKREARRGASLLKRLHLEPWTASSGSKHQSDEEKAMKLEYTKKLRDNLLHVKKLLELVQEREKTKMLQAEVLSNAFLQLLYPYAQAMRAAFERISGFDKGHVFETPVSRAEVPDYFDVVKKPMCWSMIREKLDKHQYWSLDAFRNDILLVLNNAMLYNRSETPFYKLAWRIKNNSLQPVLDELAQQTRGTISSVIGPAGNAVAPIHDNGIGELEPPLDILALLTNGAALEDTTDLILDTEPVISLFNHEFGRVRPPPPPPTPPPPPPPRPRKQKPKRDYQKERARAEERRIARAQQAMLDLGPGFRLPRQTRRGEPEASEDGSIVGPSALKASMSTDGDTSGHPESPTWDSGTRKKPTPNLMTPTSLPPVLTEVGKRDLFKAFESGWVLPEGSKRTARPAVERSSPLPPPKKRQKMSSPSIALESIETTPPPGSEVPPRAKSRLSTATPVIENETLQEKAMADPPSPAESALTSLSSGEDDGGSMEVDQLGENNVKQEELAVDVTYNQSMNADMQIPEQSPSDALQDIVPSHKPVDVPSLDTVDPENFTEPIPEIRVFDVIETPADRRKKNMLKKQLAREKRRALGIEPSPQEATMRSDMTFESGTLVWAKAKTFPWWPAVFYEDNHEDIPDGIVAQKEQLSSQGNGPWYIVRFYDKMNSWSVVNTNQIDLLGENQGTDDKYLGQKFKTSGKRRECRSYYEEAKGEIETPSDLEAAAESSSNISDEDVSKQKMTIEVLRETETEAETEKLETGTAPTNNQQLQTGTISPSFHIPARPQPLPISASNTNEASDQTNINSALTASSMPGDKVPPHSHANPLELEVTERSE